MSLWVDKYRPSSLNKLDFHPHLTSQLFNLSASGDFPHLIVYGPSGCGKKTRITAVLREIYGPSVEKVKIDHKQFQTAGGTKMDLNLVVSNFHIEMNPSDVGNYDRIVIQDVIKEIAQTQQVDTNAARHFKVVVIHEADLLSREAQAGLRRTMEKYMKNLRIILVCNSVSKLIPPIRSRCLLLRIPAPTNEDITKILMKIGAKEYLDIPPKFAQRLVIASERNLRKAILLLEALKVQKYPFEENQDIQPLDWQLFIREIAHAIVKTQNPQTLIETRGKLYELLVHCIPATDIIKYLTFELSKLIDPILRGELIQEAAYYEYRIQNGSKPIFHLEAFVSKFMAILKKYFNDAAM